MPQLPLRRTLTSMCPFRAAWCRAVRPPRSETFTLLSSGMITSAHLTALLAAATWRGVCQFLSLALTSAECLINTCTASCNRNSPWSHWQMPDKWLLHLRSSRETGTGAREDSSQKQEKNHPKFETVTASSLKENFLVLFPVRNNLELLRNVRGNSNKNEIKLLTYCSI